MSCDCIGLEWCSICQPGAKVIHKPRKPERYCTVCHDWIVGKTEELRQHRAQAHGWIRGRQPPKDQALMKEKYEILSSKLSQVRLLILESQESLRATELDEAWTIREWNLLCDTEEMLKGRINDIDERVRTEDYL